MKAFAVAWDDAAEIHLVEGKEPSPGARFSRPSCNHARPGGVRARRGGTVAPAHRVGRGQHFMTVSVEQRYCSLPAMRGPISPVWL
jgi:hypothetical protein